MSELAVALTDAIRETSDTTLDDYRDLLAGAFDDQVLAWTAEAEARQRLSRELIEHLGARRRPGRAPDYCGYDSVVGASSA